MNYHDKPHCLMPEQKIHPIRNNFRRLVGYGTPSSMVAEPREASRKISYPAIPPLALSGSLAVNLPRDDSIHYPHQPFDLRRKHGVHPRGWSHSSILTTISCSLTVPHRQIYGRPPIWLSWPKSLGFSKSKVVKCDHAGLLIHAKDITAKFQPPAASIDLEKLLILTTN